MRSDRHHNNKYLGIVIGLLIVIIGLLVFILVNGQTNLKRKTVEEVDATPSSSTKTVSSYSSTSVVQESESSSEVTTISDEENVAAEAVKKLSTSQRAALVILGAPSGWRFNGYPAQENSNQSVQEIALSNMNTITLTKVSSKLSDNTSENDQMFFATGKNIQGVGGVPSQIYAFGRDGEMIYYYVVKMNLDNPSAQPTAINLGQANMNKIWKNFFDVGDLSSMNRVADQIVIK
ncbi:hypothetical protein [Enterococcus sp. DIV1758]|uniref:hypothetical protein n=1 Tax=Enterococcus sp. DIV1758 TaxID=2774744 RepID=UPI003F20CA1C